MAGYQSRTNLSTGIHDPLSARAVAFEQDGNRLVLVSLDNLGFYNGTAEPLRQAIVEAAQLKPSELFLCAIHTHSAPTLALQPDRSHSHNVTYTHSLQSKLGDLVRKCLADLAPATVNTASGASPVGVNRREVVSDGPGQTKIVLGRNPSLVTDREVQILKVAKNPGDTLAAVVFGYATHSTSLGPRNHLISGDVHGLAEQSLERYFGSAVVAPGFAGASGDIDPWVRVLPEFRTRNGWIPEPELMGTMLAQEVARVVEGMSNSGASNGPIKTLLKTVELPAAARTNALPGEAAPAKLSIQLTVGCVGDIAFVGYGGEVFNGIGKTVKERSPFRSTFVITHCNGAAGYVPTRASYSEGGYEVQSSPFAPGSDEELINATLEGLAALSSGG
jgi:neutral ceramidase